MKRKVFYFVLLLLNLGITHISFAQKKTVLSHYHLWNTAIGDVQLHNKFYFNSELHLRFTSQCEGFQQYLFIPGIKYAHSKGLSIAAGFTYFKNFPHGKSPLPIALSENTLWQEVTLSNKVKQYSFFHRLRFEERFTQRLVISETGNTGTDGRIYNNRFRYRCLVNRPIALKEKVYVMAFNELWINIPGGTTNLSLNQNLFYLGSYYQFNKGLKLGVGLMHQYLNRGNELAESNCMLSLLCLYKIESRK
ncbi:Protein of unknown function [Lishizhenia tianjinensis]|uniref:DUF2490 domain-containing protein n=1 Tax=Lishizhenia tianjinensis TaxID=477690 RepID=A0A1I6Y0F6_9FLAO|nr:DUF2490 domain-containing protein [Lishizhenia tianjinensis]SFT44075.1 Protein of unknown function [Lishizhenia tianjinensis]